jgi:hypothetical protein
MALSYTGALHGKSTCTQLVADGTHKTLGPGRGPDMVDQTRVLMGGS